jgi:hypothetical protein
MRTQDIGLTIVEKEPELPRHEYIVFKYFGPCEEETEVLGEWLRPVADKGVLYTSLPSKPARIPVKEAWKQAMAHAAAFGVKIIYVVNAGSDLAWSGHVELLARGFTLPADLKD